MAINPAIAVAGIGTVGKLVGGLFGSSSRKKEAARNRAFQLKRDKLNWERQKAAARINFERRKVLAKKPNVTIRKTQLKKMMRQAEKHGFNPLTLLRGGAAQPRM